MGTVSFKLRRVLLAAVVGAALMSLAFYGWVQYRQSQYHDRQAAVLSRYHDDYRLCITAGNAPVHCYDQVVAACTRDPFWASTPPFSTDPGAGAADPVSSCQGGVAKG